MHGAFRYPIALVCLILLGSALAAGDPPGPSQAKDPPFQLRSSVIGAMSATSANGSHRHWGTLGQPTPGGIGQADGLTLYAGFWGWWAGHIIVSDVPLPGVLPDRLHANYPNPFNPTTRIDFTLAARKPVVLEVFDLRGARIRSLLSEVRSPGRHQVLWNGRDDFGRTVESGVYFYRLHAGDYRSTMKMLLVK
jgi:hypothetical protein